MFNIENAILISSTTHVYLVYMMMHIKKVYLNLLIMAKIDIIKNHILVSFEIFVIMTYVDIDLGLLLVYFPLGRFVSNFQGISIFNKI